MSNITTVAIDLAKNIFQLHCTDIKGNAVLKKAVSRSKLVDFMANLPPCNVFMEACGSSNYWGRRIASFGHKVKLINPKYVKPYVKRNKNDRNDALAIAVAARDPDMKFCDVKTEAQQDIQSLHRMRKLLIEQKTALINQARGLLSEYGMITAKGPCRAQKMLAEILENNKNNLSSLMLSLVQELKNSLDDLDKRIIFCDKKIDSLFNENDKCKQLEKIPGIGVIGATILAAALGNNGAVFKNGRHFSAFLGLVPKQHSSGGKENLLGISKGGDTYIRTILIHGARAVMVWVDKTGSSDKPKSELHAWARKLKSKMEVNKAVVALANKIARIAWAVVHNDIDYNPNYNTTN